MRLKTTLFVMLAFAVLSIGAASEAAAVDPYCSSCQSICASQCSNKGGCLIAWDTCGGECGGGLQTCVYACVTNEQTYTVDCYCPSCPGSSPIFKKHPTRPAPTGTESASTPAGPAKAPRSSTPATVCP